LFLARLHPRKRVLAFLEMARILRSRGVAAHYRIVGPDGGDLARAQRLVRTYGMQDEVIFVGKIQGEAIIREYLGSSVYVLPAVNEPFAMTILEALSLGVPTVVTSACYNAAMLEENGAALVSSPEPQMLANSVERVHRGQTAADPRGAYGRWCGKALGEVLWRRVCVSLSILHWQGPGISGAPGAGCLRGSG
jgi:glycosyltransferase involved in cell wall biosynthesis